MWCLLTEENTCNSQTLFLFNTSAAKPEGVGLTSLGGIFSFNFLEKFPCRKYDSNPNKTNIAGGFVDVISNKAVHRKILHHQYWNLVRGSRKLAMLPVLIFLPFNANMWKVYIYMFLVSVLFLSVFPKNTTHIKMDIYCCLSLSCGKLGNVNMNCNEFVIFVYFCIECFNDIKLNYCQINKGNFNSFFLKNFHFLGDGNVKFCQTSH